VIQVFIKVLNKKNLKEINFGENKVSKPTNPTLYARAKAIVKGRVKKWPSAYASGQLVRQYKKMGGKYKS